VSDTFAFRAVPVPLRRRINLRVVKTILIGLVVVLGVGAFAGWAIDSERESFAREASHARSSQAIVRISYADASASGSSVTGVDGISAADKAAQDVIRQTMSRARALAGRPLDLSTAGPGQLSAHEKGVVFTDGPSLSPQIVSVAAAQSGWAAAAMSDSGLCFAVRLDGNGAVRFGTVPLACTGTAALKVSGVSW
jgi:hypothetical protein